MNASARSSLLWLGLGDSVALLLVTLIGERSHNIPLASGRWLSTFVPLLLAWSLTAPWLGLYSEPIARRPQVIWRTAWAAILATPLATWMRGLWLQSAISPIFVLVLVGFVALATALWRGITVLLVRRQGIQ